MWRKPATMFRREAVAEHDVERTPGMVRDEGAQQIEAGVRVDPAATGRGQDRGPLEAEPGGMGEEVADRRARRTRRLIEVEQPPIGGDQDGRRGHQLGHRRPPEAVCRVPVPGQQAGRGDDRRGGVARAPRVDDRERGRDATRPTCHGSVIDRGYIPVMQFLFSRQSKLPSPAEALPGRPDPIVTPGRHTVLGTPLAGPWPDGTRTAIFGLGCFWGAEKDFWQLPGVVTTAVGYAGGSTPNPTYQESCTGKTGHAEVVLVAYDPARITYAQLLKTDLVSPPDVADWRAQNRVFQQMADADDATYTLTGVGEPTSIVAYQLSPEFFSVLGVAPQAGRTFHPEETQPGKNHVVVLSHRLWQNRFGGDPGEIGKAITLNGEKYSVIGIMPPGFSYPTQDTELWTPLTVDSNLAGNHGLRYLRVLARLKPGANT